MANIFDLFKKIEKKEESTSPVSFIIAGLGNIGKQYERTRHNAGFMAIDAIAERLGVKIDRVKFHATVAEATLGDTRLLLMKPTTLMNNSGVAIGEAAAFYKIAPERVLVLVDDISLSPGVIRIRRKGSAGGHNGLKSIIASLSSDAFPRIKIGVGQKPTPEYDLVSWVLGTLPVSDMTLLSERFSDIYEAASLTVRGEIDTAMNKYSR
ncbi:MAG: aminoacyl-tRNA hydrolase [Clostridia bacterium]|nr:aminoacyl-tRNA hydrolase [Clostridia bacterium]MBO5207653.1 aminoacyl-tRNA hydrolase [Clostridia bacterium]MBP3582796.1 aminoacyl-tRNA hydrolase [Clostridia bacterium]MBQ8584555.1 aminoacyl-tRNA hydrolase [Clostridia bacterium]